MKSKKKEKGRKGKEKEKGGSKRVSFSEGGGGCVCVE
jgi:hypothetical protein